jgi:outer membrane lipoprotein-sorting protein
VRWIVLLLAGVLAFPQNLPSPRKILDQVRATYTGVRRFEIAGDVEITSAGASKPQLAEPFRVVADYPDKFRLEGSMGPVPRSEVSANVMISDGKITWRYDSRRRLYTRKTGPPEMDLDVTDGELRQMGVDPASSDAVKLGDVMLAGFRKLSTLADRATVRRTETVRLGDKPVECYVLETQEKPGGAKARWLIDTGGFRIRRMESADQGTTIRMTFHTVSLNEPLPDGVFAFVPPAGARQVDELQ